MIESNTINKPVILAGRCLQADASELLRLQNKLDNVIAETNQFTYIVTHDLQAPLRMVTGFLDLLERKYADQLDAGARQYIRYAVKGSLKMKDLIFDLLEYSRLSSTVHSFETMSLDEIMLSVKEKLKEKIEKTNAEIIAEDLPELYGSKKMIEQLLTHLLDNSLKFKSNLPPKVYVRSTKDETYLKIDVADNGIGIDPNFFERIFTIFKKLHPEEAGYEGTGTGLAICKKIAELHHGMLEVISQPGNGSTFSIRVPYK